MKLEDRTEVLVAIGSAAAVNCQDCLDRLRNRAAGLAIGPAEMAAAAQVGLRVGRSAADRTARIAAALAELADPAAEGRPGAPHAGPARAGHACCGASTKEGC